MSLLRTFIAVPLPPEVTQAATKLARDLSAVADGIKWVEPQSMHLTLKFLGNITDTDSYEVCQAVTRAAEKFEAFDFRCAGAGAFPSLSRPRTIWIGGGEGSEQIAALARAVDDALFELGYRREPKRFTPHLTIGRVKTPGRQLEALSRLLAERADFDAGVAYVDEVVIYSSDLTPQGPIHTPLGHAELK
jgi:2'-5' RNA ligase